MAISIKNSRNIVVSGELFRWSSSQGSGYMILVVQHGSGEGEKLEVVISNDQNVVVENGSYSIEIGSSNKLIITPKLVQQVILDAIAMGWFPQRKGAPVELFLNGITWRCVVVYSDKVFNKALFRNVFPLRSKTSSKRGVIALWRKCEYFITSLTL